LPEFTDETTTTAPPEEVWKLLYDPTRFPEWWLGMDLIHDGDDQGGEADFTYYAKDWPDFPMPQRFRADSEDRRVTVTCMVSEIDFAWVLEPTEQDGTHIAVRARIPDVEAEREPAIRQMIAGSMRRLAALAEAAATA
jgi:uncharacterized protein YndB with AHSA1/START domain